MVSWNNAKPNPTELMLNPIVLYSYNNKMIIPHNVTNHYKAVVKVCMVLKHKYA